MTHTEHDVFRLPAPAFTVDELAAIAREHFGTDGRLTMLDSERDQNARIESADGAYVLKVANAGEDHAVLDLQLAMLRHLEHTAPDLSVPRVVDTVDGAGYADVTGPNGAHRVRLVTHLDGDVLAHVVRTPHLERELGRADKALGDLQKAGGMPAAEKERLLNQFDQALQGLQNGALKPNPGLLDQLKELDPKDLGAMNPEQLQQLNRLKKEANHRGGIAAVQWLVIQQNSRR